MTRRLGPLAPEREGRVRRLSREELEALGDALVDVSTATDLLAWVQQYPA